ncbi:hypothetical protein ZWY2020_060032, partial [Hordeum vulgare]
RRSRVSARIRAAQSSMTNVSHHGGPLHRHGRRDDRRRLPAPVGITLFNLSESDFAVRPGDRVVQMIVQVIATPDVAEVKDLDATLQRSRESGTVVGKGRPLDRSRRDEVLFSAFF